MISIDDLFNMIATDAVEGGSRVHYFDERNNITPKTVYEQSEAEKQSPPMKFRLEVVRQPDGTYELVE